MLTEIESNAPWTNVYGLARSLIASSTAIILAINPTWALFRPGAGVKGVIGCTALASHISLFCVTRPHIELARGIAVAILLVVITGWRPRLTGVFHWWISYSFYASARVADGGEQVAAILTLLLLPLTLTDRRRWHWKSIVSAPVSSEFDAVMRLIGTFSAFVIQLQVAYIYLDAFIEKLRVPEWLDGTMMYYVFHQSLLGAPAFLQGILFPLTASPLVVLLAWPALLLEFSLATNMLMRARVRQALFYCGVAFHTTIALFIGIPSFSTIMIGALLLGVVPIGWNLNRLFSLDRLGDSGQSRFRVAPTDLGTDLPA